MIELHCSCSGKLLGKVLPLVFPFDDDSASVAEVELRCPRCKTVRRFTLDGRLVKA